MSAEALHFVPLIARGERFGTPYWLNGVAESVFAGLVPVGVEPTADDLRETFPHDGELVVQCGPWLSPGPHQLVIAAFDNGGLMEINYPGVVMVTDPGDPAL